LVYKNAVEAFIRKERKRGDVLPRAPRSESDFFPIFADLLGRLVEAKEQEVDIRRAEAGLPPRATRAGRGRPGFGFDRGLDDDDDDDDDHHQNGGGQRGPGEEGEGEGEEDEEMETAE